MNFKKSYDGQKGFTPLCNEENSSLSMLRFGIARLDPGDSLDYNTGGCETAFIILGGTASFCFDDTAWYDVGGRADVFDGKAHCVYLPRNKTLTITGRSAVKIAVVSTEIDQDTQPQLIQSEDIKTTVLGEKPCKRDVHFIIGSDSSARKLTIGEAFVESGNWAGFPPHKHDEDNMPAEGIQEEIYYYRFEPQQGFGLQYMYTKDGDFDVCYPVKNEDLVEFPRGYHTTVMAPGYKSYFLWAMAGEHQGFCRTNDPSHDNSAK